MAVAAFPGLKPSARSWTVGSRPVKSFTSLSGYEARVLLGPLAIGGSIGLQFTNLLEADVLQITGHYETAKGSYEVFDLPASVFAGMANGSSVTPATAKWRYGGPPSVDWVAPGIASVNVSLVQVY
jgi:hypothetical protein